VTLKNLSSSFAPAAGHQGRLLNQNLLSGVGNIYADESLFRAASARAGNVHG